MPIRADRRAAAGQLHDRRAACRGAAQTPVYQHDLRLRAVAGRQLHPAVQHRRPVHAQPGARHTPAGAAAEDFGLGRDTGAIRPEGATEVRQAATAFNRMQERIRRFLTQRTEMLAGVSHDLRTPLTRLRLALAMLPAEGALRRGRRGHDGGCGGDGTHDQRLPGLRPWRAGRAGADGGSAGDAGGSGRQRTARRRRHHRGRAGPHAPAPAAGCAAPRGDQPGGQCAPPCAARWPCPPSR